MGVTLDVEMILALSEFWENIDLTTNTFFYVSLCMKFKLMTIQRNKDTIKYNCFASFKHTE